MSRILLFPTVSPTAMRPGTSEALPSARNAERQAREAESSLRAVRGEAASGKQLAGAHRPLDMEAVKRLLGLA